VAAAEGVGVIRRSLRAVTLLLAITGGWLLVQGGWIEAKAWLARGLIEQAWRTTLATGAPSRPWPWADTWPVARLTVPGLGIERMVLHGASGRTLAFGPAWDSASTAPGGNGLVLLSGHRDTHFRFLADLEPGSALALVHRVGETRYVVESTEVFDSRRQQVVDHDGDDRLVLVTCYPFDTLRPGGPLRYAVTARRVFRGEEQRVMTSSGVPENPVVGAI
jgi:sortase A